MSKGKTPARFRDFDAFLREKRGKVGAVPVTFQLGNVRYTLPSELPALVAIETLRLQKQADSADDVPADSILALATALFGEEQLNAILHSGISIEELGDIIGYVMEQYGEVATDTDDEDDSGNAPTPEPAGATST
jgi:hypothetical protein